ncbi:MAG: IS1634 family transposase [Bacteroidota bacterium]|nr:IS1634 family transposase [Bacteroidota bacterium]
MYVQRNKTTGKNGKAYTSTLLCTKYRQDGKIKTKVEANLSYMPEELVLTVENVLKHGKGALVAAKSIMAKSAIDFGLAFLLIHLMDKLRISQTIEKVLPPQEAALLKAIVIGKIITRGSKLGIYNWLGRNKNICSQFGIDMGNIKVDHLYSALGQASEVQKAIERKWLLYHKNKHKEVYLYDITSTYFEGTQNELAAYGYNRDKKKGKMQINIGLITDSEGFPLKIEVFEGNISDYTTVLEQIKSIKEEFNTSQVIFVGDRGMKIRYNLEGLDEADKQGVHYITGLTNQEIKNLLDNDIIQLKLFSNELAEVEYEGERYVLSVNAALQEQELAYLKTIRGIADDEISEVKASWEKRHRQNTENIQKLKDGHKNKKLVASFSEKQLDSYKLRIEKILSKRRLKQYYEIIEISNQAFVIDFKAEKYQQAKQLAGKYVVCTNVEKGQMEKTEVRQQYKNLQHVEQAFRDFKSDNIQVRPVYHRNEAQTRGHVLLSMFSYAIVKEMEDKIFPFLVAWNKKTKSKLSFSDILEELKDIKLVTLDLGRNVESIKITQLNDLQEQVLKLFKMKKTDLEKNL